MYDEALGRRGALQAVALADIATQLRALRELAPRPTRTRRRSHLLLRDLVRPVHRPRRRTPRRSWARCSATIDLHDADAEAFRAYKDRLIDYLSGSSPTSWPPARRSPRWWTAIEAAGVERAAGRGRRGGRRPTRRRARVRRRRPARGRVRPAGRAVAGAVGAGSAAVVRQRRRSTRARPSCCAVAGPRGDPAAAARRGRAQRAPLRAVRPLGGLPRRSRCGSPQAPGRGGDAPAVAGARSGSRRLAAPDRRRRDARRAGRTSPGAGEHALGRGAAAADQPAAAQDRQLRAARASPTAVADRAEQRRHLAELAAREAEQTAAARAALATERPAAALATSATLDRRRVPAVPRRCSATRSPRSAARAARGRASRPRTGRWRSG